MSRLRSLNPDELTGKQRQLYDAIAGDARRNAARTFKMTADNGALGGPFNVLLYAPQVGEAIQQLGAALRFDSSLPGHLRELAILMVAQRWRANYEWYAHAPIAAREGLDEATIEAIKTGKAPDDATGKAGEDVKIVCRFVTELTGTRRVSAVTYSLAKALLGEPGLVELIALVGYYSLIAGLLNTFEVAVPDGETPPFGE